MNELLMVAEEVGVDERTLRRAINQGTVRAERVSPRKLRLSYREAQYLRRQWPLLGKLRAALRTEPNVRFALLFGSTARGDDHEGSDVDLLVVLRDSSLRRRLDLELRLEETLGRKVDVLMLDAAKTNSTLFAMAVEEGRVLVDRIDLWSKLSAESGKLERRARRDERRLKREALAGIDRMLAR
jgi:predicted nucleotidyltransferase